MPCQPCLSDGIWTAWNYLWQKYELFSTFFHYFPKFSTIFSTAQLCFSRSIKAFCRHVGSGKPPPPRPLALPHMYSITSSLPCPPSHRRSLVVPHFIYHFSSITSSIICRPSLHLPLLLHHFIDHLSSITSSITSSLTSSTTCRPPLRPSLVHPPIVDHLSSITSSTTSPPSHHRSFVVHILHYLSPFTIPRLD